MPRGKKSDGPSRSQLIRDFMKENPTANAAEVVAALAKQGVKVSAGLVYMNKGRLKQVKVHRKRKMKRAVRVARVAASSNGKASDPVALIRKVRDLAHEAGGFGNLKELIGVLSE